MATQNLTKVNGVYQIGSAADLQAFSALVNGGETSANAELTANINLDNAVFTPIGNANENSITYAYRGTFDGKGFTISHATIASAYNMGIFGFVENGTVKNLTVDYITVNSSETENEAAAAAVIGSIHQGHVIDVTAGEHCTVVGINRVGGVIGSARDRAEISGCINCASVTGSGMYTGGVIGASHDFDTSFIFVTGGPATVTDCYNYGNVNGNTEVGGIIGYSDQAAIESCHNEGDITATGNYGTGGIIGFDAYNPRLGGLYSPSKGSSVSDCSNSGTITGPRSGGIVGTLGVTPGQSQPNSNKTLTSMTGCTNSGNISGTAGKCGAIFGYPITYAYGDGTNNIDHLYVKITGCTNSGMVNAVTPDNLTPSPYVEN